MSLLGQRQYTDAESLLIRGWEGMDKQQERIPTNSKLSLKQALEGLVQLCEATDRPDQASAWKQKLAAFR
jgi:hypothetical protein